MTAVGNAAVAIERAYSPDARHLYFLFGGIAAGLAMPPFEFYSASRILGENKLFIRDIRQSWYHGGLPGFSEDIDATICLLRDEIDALDPEKVFFVGNSMGGFAAILSAALIGRGEAVAFAPQTFIGPFARLRAMDFRWQPQITRMYFSSIRKPRYYDLRQTLLERPTQARVRIFVSNSHRLDRTHAFHLQGVPGVEIVCFDGGGHGIVKDLRDRGLLPAILSGIYVHGA